MKCPKCNSEQIRVIFANPKPLIIESCSQRTRAGKSFKKYQKFICEECNYKWKK
jgi:transposase-like protein